MKQLGYALYMAIMAVTCGLILLTPLLAESGNHSLADALYFIGGTSCHQLTERSLCLFHPASGYSISDCGGPTYSKANTVEQDGVIGYKLPVCARDVGIYFAMLLGGIALFFVKRTKDTEWPSPFILIAFLIPMGIDGGTQLLSLELANYGIVIPGIGVRESTNFLRLLTGSLAGFAVAFYLVPMLNRLIESITHRANEKRPAKEVARKEATKEPYTQPPTKMPPAKHQTRH